MIDIYLRCTWTKKDHALYRLQLGNQPPSRTGPCTACSTFRRGRKLTLPSWATSKRPHIVLWWGPHNWILHDIYVFHMTYIKFEFKCYIQAWRFVHMNPRNSVARGMSSFSNFSCRKTKLAVHLFCLSNNANLICKMVTLLSPVVPRHCQSWHPSTWWK